MTGLAAGSMTAAESGASRNHRIRAAATSPTTRANSGSGAAYTAPREGKVRPRRRRLDRSTPDTWARCSRRRRARAPASPSPNGSSISIARRSMGASVANRCSIVKQEAAPGGECPSRPGCQTPGLAPDWVVGLSRCLSTNTAAVTVTKYLNCCDRWQRVIKVPNAPAATAPQVCRSSAAPSPSIPQWSPRPQLGPAVVVAEVPAAVTEPAQGEEAGAAGLSRVPTARYPRST